MNSLDKLGRIGHIYLIPETDTQETYQTPPQRSGRNTDFPHDLVLERPRTPLPEVSVELLSEDE